MLSHISNLEKTKVRNEKRLQEQKTLFDAKRQKLEELQHDSRMKNLAVDELDMKIRNYKKQLKEGIISFKEMESLRKKIDNEERRISDMEDEAIFLMENLEDSRTALARSEDQYKEYQEKLATEEQDVDEKINDLKGELVDCETERQEIANRVPRHIRFVYQSLAQKLDDPVVPINGESCSGCNLRLSTITLERVRARTEIVTCETCSRILYYP